MLHTFLDFELDEELCELRSQGQVIATQSRAFDMIVYLLHARDRVVSRNELMDALWNGSVVSDAAISQVIMLARKAVRDEGESQRVIKTVRGRGIRFVADVQTRSRKSEPPLPALPLPEVIACDDRTPLLGRSTELRALLARLGRAELGQGSLVLIEGDPGMGKTTLAEELAAQAQTRGFEVIWGRAWEDGGAPPFWPWIQVLRAIAQREGPERMQDWLGSGATELLPLLPEYGSDAQQRSDVLTQDVGGARARFRQFDVLSRLLRHLCGRGPGDATTQRRRPWLIILDDLHAADDASVQLVRFLMPDLGDLGLLLVGTYRGLECASKEALSALSESCGDNTLRLRGLAPTDVSELLSRKLGQPPPGRFAATLHNLSAGNPLLLAELCSRLDRDHPEPLVELSHLAEFALPERIASAVRRHLTELPADTRTALSAASALGREFSQPLLADLLGCSEAELLDRLGPALRRGVLRPTGSSSRLLFSHVLVCNAVYSELAPQRRLELHRRIGELLEASAPARLPLHELAHHYFLAASHGCRAKALDYAARAAEQACNVMAHESGAALFDRAIALAELENVDGERLHKLLCDAGTAWYRSGDLERATARYDHAAELARAEGAIERFAQAIMLSGCALRGQVLHDTRRQEQLREALRLLPEGDGYVRARLLSLNTLGMRSADTLAERQATTLAAVEMARRLGDPDSLLWTLNARHLVLWGGAPPEEMVLVAREMVELSTRTQNSEVLLDALLWLGCDYIEMGDPMGMWQTRDAYAAAVERYKSPWHRYMAAGSDTLVSWVLGDLAQARVHSSRMLALGRRVQEGLADTFHALRTMFLDHQEGRERKLAASPFQVADMPACVAHDYRPFWALTWADRGHVEAARQVLDQVLACERQLLDALRRPILAVMAEVSVMLNDRVAAQKIYRMLAPDAGRHLMLQACVYLGPVDHYLGLLAEALDQREAAVAHYERALALSISPTTSAQTQYAYGRTLRAQRDSREHARRLLASAEDNAGRLGMTQLFERAHSALAELG